MSGGPANQETEIKLRLRDAAEGRRLLERNGFRVLKPRVFEANLVLDTEDHRLSAAGSLLRLRRTGPDALLTFKGPAGPGRHKSREELDVSTSDAARTAEILGRLGFHAAFRYEKYRTEYSEPGRAGLATLDETPIGAFLELEGLPEWIDATAACLGFTEADYVTASYAALYFEHCGRQGIPAGNMVFPADV